MKGIDILCASPSSTAVCMSMDHNSMVRHGGRVLDRHNPHIRDTRIDRHNPHIRDTRKTNLFNPSSSLPPKPKSHHHRTKKSSSSEIHNQKPKRSTELVTPHGSSRYLLNDIPKKSTELVTPPGSSRYLLSDTSFPDIIPDYDPVPQLVPINPTKTIETQVPKSAIFKPSDSSPHHDQVVVLKVSLHCKGCEGKVRKHISRMEGVSSFSIDFATKKVTVIGAVSPLGVLQSISRVKNAQFWSSSSTSIAEPGFSDK